MPSDSPTNAAAGLPPEKQQGFIDALLENVEDAIVACDAAGVLTVFNHAARELHGLAERPIEADGWADYYDLYLPDGRTRMRKEEIPLYRALQGERVRNVEMVVAPKGGAPRTYTGPSRVSPSTGTITELVRTGAFEGVLTWVIGVEAEAPFHVTTLQSPPRLVVDLTSSSPGTLFTASSTGRVTVTII